MVNEREPPRYTNSRGDTQNEPEFGKASPLRNPLNCAPSNVFNVPKPGQRRPEHHRKLATQPPLQSSSASQQDPKKPLFGRSYPSLSSSNSSPDFVEIARPSNFPAAPIYAAPRPTFSTSDTFEPVNTFKPVNRIPGGLRVDGVASHEFDPDRLTGSSFDPTNFVDAAQTNENIKALLEGAFDEDEDDKPRTRLRKRNQNQTAISLTNEMQRLEVGSKYNEAEELEKDDGTVEGLNVKLLPHQIDGLAWMLDKEIGTRKKNGVLPKGGILADDMGLGKTIQALALILSNPKPAAPQTKPSPDLQMPKSTAKTTLVVAPLALIKQWESEIKSKIWPTLGLKVLVHHGPLRTKEVRDLERQDIVITTYQTLTSEHEASSSKPEGPEMGCLGVYWYRVILDEAHSIKNRNAKMSKSAYALRSVYRWCLTGTPMQNNLDELQSLIKFLNIKPYNDIKAWKDQIIKPMKGGRGGLAIKRLQYFLKAFMKRRTKDILKQEGALTFGTKDITTNDKKGEEAGFKIVARNVQTVVAHFDLLEREFYQKLEDRTNKNLTAIIESDKADYIGALVLLLRLRQACNHPELSRANLAKDNESLSAETGSEGQPRSSSPSKNSRVDEVDDVADLLGGLTVKTKKCDSCGSKLNLKEQDAGYIRCGECKIDFEKFRRQSGSIEPQRQRAQSKHLARQRRAFQARRISESEDEDEDEDGSLEDSIPELPGHESNNVEFGKESNSDEDAFDEENLQRKNKHQAMCSTKIRRLIKILDEESDQHKFIVFSEFTSMLDIVEPFLQQHGFRFVRYDGKMRNDDREASLEKLRNDPRTRVLLCSLRCGSLGLNLTAASRVVLMEPFWNPFVEEQAIDRVHRLNQTQDVNVYRLTIADSVEQRILTLQEKKRELAKAAVEGGKATAKLSMQDVLDLFKRDAEAEDHEGDARLDILGTPSAGGVLRGHSSQNPPGSAITINSTSLNKKYFRPPQSPTRDRSKSKPKFQIPPNLRAEYEALYGRRW